MLLDANHVRRGASLVADVCVIGAGAAGITIARELDGAGLNVLVLESGGFNFDKATQALYKGKAVGLPLDPKVDVGLDGPRLRYFGGTTNHWAGYCRPFTALDLQTRAYVPRSGWPMALGDLEPYYLRAQEVCGIGPYEYTVDYWRREGLIDHPLLEAATTPHAVVQITDAPRFGEVYRDDLVASKNVQLCIRANVTRLALSADGAAVSKVDVATLSGNRFTATANVFVVATGGLEVPRLLLASNDRRPGGIGNENDLVGRHFMEHVNIASGVVLLATDFDGLAPYTPTPRTINHNGVSRDLSLQAVLLLAPDVLQAEGLRSCEVTIEYGFPVDDRRLENLFPGTRQGTALVRAEGIDPGVGAVVRVLCEQEPNPASRVTLTRARDKLGMPRIQLDWRITRDDRLSMLRTLRLVGAQVAQRGLGRLRVDIDGFVDADPPASDPLDYPVNIGCHHMGTARMHASSRSGVVDPDCRVHSVKNLYIAGSAVFPTSGANTPTLTIVALALRLADHLKTAAT
jgi:choline dehydrogenase-like flavoprotein